MMAVQGVLWQASGIVLREGRKDRHDNSKANNEIGLVLEMPKISNAL